MKYSGNIFPRYDKDIPSFSLMSRAGIHVHVHLKNRSRTDAEWLLNIGIHQFSLSQAEAVKLAVEELNRRRAGLSYDGMKEGA
jgi:hypothetical protein